MSIQDEAHEIDRDAYMRKVAAVSLFLSRAYPCKCAPDDPECDGEYEEALEIVRMVEGIDHEASARKIALLMAERERHHAERLDEKIRDLDQVIEEKERRERRWSFWRRNR